MSAIYREEHRELQDRFGTRRLADRLEELIVHGEIGDAERAFIEGRDMFFLATVDAEGRPTVSYKGGAPGFVRVLDPRTLAFPSYDGNGMYYSLGNVAATAEVGMLFIDLERPNRLRVQGTATVGADDPLLAEYPEAELIVRVTVREVFVNCGRYIHPHRKIDAARHVPTPDRPTPLAAWKRIDIAQEVLPAKDAGRAEREGGTITMEEYGAKVAAGEA